MAALTATSISLASCGDDDDDDDDSYNTEEPADTNKVVTPTDTTSKQQETPAEEETTVQYTLNDIIGVWHMGVDSNYKDAYISISADKCEHFYLNNNYPNEDKWTHLTMVGCNVNEKNVVSWNPSYIGNAYGWTIKSVNATEMVITPKYTYLSDDYDTITLTKVDAVPTRLSSGDNVMLSMDYTSWAE